MNSQEYLTNSHYTPIGLINEEHKTYLVRDTETNRIYVWKCLTDYDRGLLQELMNNPPVGMPRIHAILECDDDSIILLEEQITGLTLRDLMKNETITREQACRIIMDVCDIMLPLHTHVPPIVHRDLTPSNIMIDNQNHVVVIDLNAAKYCNLEAKSDTVLLGTPGYAAPEQYGFRSSSPQSDIYALGVLLEKLLEGSAASTPALEEVIKKCKRMEPTERYTNVNALKRAIQGALDHPNTTYPNNVAVRVETPNTPPPSSVNPPTPPVMIITEKSTENANFSSVIHSWFPPGFRSRNIPTWILACVGYYLIFYLSLTLELSKPTPNLNLLKGTSLVIMLGLTFWLGNYRNIQRVFPPCRSRNILVRWIGALLAGVAYVFLVFFITSLLAV